MSPHGLTRRELPVHSLLRDWVFMALIVVSGTEI